MSGCESLIETEPFKSHLLILFFSRCNLRPINVSWVGVAMWFLLILRLKDWLLLKVEARLDQRKGVSVGEDDEHD